jgi:hypothetical protein
MGIEELRQIRQDRDKPKEKKIYKLRSVSEKKKAKLAEQAKEKNSDGDTFLDAWFKARRKEMTGKCVLCGGKTEKDNDETYKRSIHHLFDKRETMFPSVALNPDNWLELCFWENSCHQNIHNGTITWELLQDSKEWDIILAKFRKVYPFIAEEERRHLPEVLLKYLELHD